MRPDLPGKPPLRQRAGRADPAPTAPTATAPEELPTGLGALWQEEISITLRRRDLQIRVTPPHESVIRVTAPRHLRAPLRPRLGASGTLP